MARAVGVGEFLATDEVRATLFVRLVGIAHGASGLSPAFAAVFATCWTRAFIPACAASATLGEADLSPLAQLFLPLVGQGEAELGGRVMPGREALQRGRHRTAGARSQGRDRAAERQCLQRRHRRARAARCTAGAAGADRGRALSLEAAGANLSPHRSARSWRCGPRPDRPTPRDAAVAAQGQRSPKADAAATGAGPAVVSLPRPGERRGLRAARARTPSDRGRSQRRRRQPGGAGRRRRG